MTLTRRISVAAVATGMAFTLAACGSEDTETPDTTADPTPTAPADPEPTDEGNGMEGAAAQVFGPACDAVPQNGAGSFDGMVQDPVATAASNNPLLSTLVTAVSEAGLVDTLNDAEGLTVFAPTNDAFGKLPEEDLNAVLADKDLLTNILTYHVVSGQLDPDAVVGEQESLQGGTVTVEGDTDGMTVNGAAVLCGNVPTANATVYIIDEVLMPS